MDSFRDETLKTNRTNFGVATNHRDPGTEPVTFCLLGGSYSNELPGLSKEKTNTAFNQLYFWRATQNNKIEQSFVFQQI